MNERKISIWSIFLVSFLFERLRCSKAARREDLSSSLLASKLEGMRGTPQPAARCYGCLKSCVRLKAEKVGLVEVLARMVNPS